MRIAILTTGGTIEKTYCEFDGSLSNRKSNLHEILRVLRLPELDYSHKEVMSKDSLQMTEADREVIAGALRAALAVNDAALIIHGTDTLETTGDYLHHRLEALDKPVVLTGAMKPFELRDTDAFQNVTEALLACRLLPAGVYVVMHNRALRFPGARKDRQRLTFVRE